MNVDENDYDIVEIEFDSINLDNQTEVQQKNDIDNLDNSSSSKGLSLLHPNVQKEENIHQIKDSSSPQFSDEGYCVISSIDKNKNEENSSSKDKLNVLNVERSLLHESYSPKAQSQDSIQSQTMDRTQSSSPEPKKSTTYSKVEITDPKDESLIDLFCFCCREDVKACC